MTALQQSVAIGPAVFTIGQLLLVFAYFVALIAGHLAGLRREVKIADTLIKIVMVSLLAGRVIFVARYWGSFDGVLAMLDIRDGGFDPSGALIGGMVYSAWVFWNSPQARSTLATALICGGLAWGLTAGPLMIIEQQSRPLPEVMLSTSAGERISLPQLAEQKNEPLVVNLWATWCPHCISEMSMFAEAQRKETDITFVFINQGEGPSRVRSFLDKKGLRMDNILIDPHNSFGEAIGSKALPTTLFYSESGQLVDSRSGRISWARLESGLERLR